MAALLWGGWGEEWALQEKVSFNGTTKQIVVLEGVTSLDIRADVYSAWVRWVERETNSQYLPALRFSGLDPIPGGFTGATFFTTNGWKLCYDPNLVAVSGVLYSDDYPTAFWSPNGVSPVYPATVSALALSPVGDIIASIDASEVAAAVWNSAVSAFTQNGTFAKLIQDELAKLSAIQTATNEVHALHGLAAPLVVTQTTRTAGDIVQNITLNEQGDTTITRQ